MTETNERTRTVRHPEEGETILTLEHPNGGEVKKGFKLYLDIQKAYADEEQGIEGSGQRAVGILEAYTEHLETMSSKGIGKSIAWLDQLPDTDKETIIRWYDERVKKRLDFMRLSDNQAN